MRKTFFCIDAHTCGNPVRLVAGGGPLLEGATMREKRLYFLEHYDWIRKGLMFEPRGHDMMSGSILYAPSSKDYDIAVLFIETSGCLPMCGHGTIGTVTAALEAGLVTPATPGTLRLETPAGLVVATYKEVSGKIKSVKLINVPSFLAAKDLQVNHPELGVLNYDVAFGGNFYAIGDPQKNFSGMQNHTALDIIRWSRQMRTDWVKQIASYIRLILLSKAFIMLCGPASPLRPPAAGVTRYFTARKPLTGLPVAPAPPPVWRSYMPEANLKRGKLLSMKAS